MKISDALIGIVCIVAIVIMFAIAFDVLDTLRAEVCRVESAIGLLQDTRLNCERPK